jgi:hypothetical protein
MKKQVTEVKYRGKTLPYHQIEMAPMEIGPYFLGVYKGCEIKNHFFELEQGKKIDDFYLANRKDLTFETAKSELLQFRSKYWEEKRVHALVDVPVDAAPAPAYTQDVTGLFFDTSLVLSGIPECWFDQASQPGKRITIRIYYFVESRVKSTDLFKAYESVVNIYKSLIQSGYQVRLEIVYSGMATNAKIEAIAQLDVTVPIADFNQRLDEAPFVYAVSPTFYRTIYIGLTDAFAGAYNTILTPEMKSKITHGKTIEFDGEVLSFYGIVLENKDQYTEENISRILKG